MLSDITVCDKPGTNPDRFDDTVLPHVSGITSWALNYFNHVLTQSPKILCDTESLDANGEYLKQPYQKGEIPNVQEPGSNGRMSEGFTVLTNGVNVGGRTGNPHVVGPLGDLAPGVPAPLNVQRGQGLRLQIVNPSPVRYMRLRLTDSMGVQKELVRIGGEGGLLDSARLEGDTALPGFKFNYNEGEILIPPAGRADVMARIPPTAKENSLLTLWTADFERVEATYSWLPTVPVMHLKVTNAPPADFASGAGTALLSQVGASVGNLPDDPPDTLRDPVLDSEDGSKERDIHLTFNNIVGDFQASIDEIPMPRDFNGDFDGGNPFFLESARHATLSDVIELKVTNRTGTNHPFHLHGFSFQPKSLTPRTIPGTDPPDPPKPSYNFLYDEFRDIMDVPGNYTLTFVVSLDGRPLKGATSGVDGGKGRWLFHCHILPHATFGMMSELHVH
ncbi:MAG: hypothetical protein CV089_07355 [Nitrospira sp. WS110]|nr:hypothetical protein [Nitrospira sp. WS110]